MNTSQIKISLIIVVFILSCNQTTRNKKNIVQVKEFGDTMRLEVEKKGDTLIKRYLDIGFEKKKGDDFDDSYTSLCTYQSTPLDTTIEVRNAKVKIKTYLIENYETEFSSGQNFYYVTVKGDTLFKEHRLGIIR